MLNVFELANPLTPAVNIDAPIERAAQMFELSNFSMLPVVRDGKFCGVLERHEVEKLPGYSCARVHDLLCREMVCLAPGDAVEIAANLLATGFIDLVPVVDDLGYFSGIITAADIPPEIWHSALAAAEQD